MFNDVVKFKVSLVDSRNGKLINSEILKGCSVTSANAHLHAFCDDYLRYLYNDHPYTRLIITPLVSEDTGELFNIKNDVKNV